MKPTTTEKLIAILFLFWAFRLKSSKRARSFKELLNTMAESCEKLAIDIERKTK